MPNVEEKECTELRDVVSRSLGVFAVDNSILLTTNLTEPDNNIERVCNVMKLILVRTYKSGHKGFEVPISGY